MTIDFGFYHKNYYNIVMVKLDELLFFLTHKN